MNPGMRSAGVRPVLVVALAVVTGCSPGSKLPTGPGASLVGDSDQATLADAGATGSILVRPGLHPPAFDSEFFPLDSGSVWTFARTFRVQISPGSAPDFIEMPSTIVARMLGTVDLGIGARYTMERDDESDGSSEFSTWIYFRQDASGLFEVGPPIRAAARDASPRGGRVATSPPMRNVLAAASTPTARSAWERAGNSLEERVAAIEWLLGRPRNSAAAPADGLPVEFQRLRYPLFPGQQWVFRQDPRVEMVVNDRDVIRLNREQIPAWRISLRFTDLFGPRDHVEMWYGPAGFLGLSSHLEADAVGPLGDIYGTVVTEDIRRLTSLSVVGRYTNRSWRRGPVASGQAVAASGRVDASSTPYSFTTR